MSITHGSVAGYDWHGCRCTRCTETHRNRVRRNRAERLAAGQLTHGTRSAYDAGCRCGECKHARHAAHIRLGSEGRTS